MVIGLGYVGLPLACELARSYRTTGYDRDVSRIDELNNGIDRTGSVERTSLESHQLDFSSDDACISEGQIIIVAVPTPVDPDNNPDLSSLTDACATVGSRLEPGAVVVIESTVYPGVTEDVCMPIIEKHSGLKCGIDFKVGYSPERINPGDGGHQLRNTVKVIAGGDADALDLMDEIYSKVTDAGTFRAENIKTAEAAKVIENVQRDVNIALTNEFAVIFEKMGLSTASVLAAASTKWNFERYRPGLVGGHCIGVDPYYLSHAAQQIGIEPNLTLAGRETNSAMPGYVANKTMELLVDAGCRVNESRILVLGAAYKADVPDARNTGVTGVVRGLTGQGAFVDVYDPLIEPQQLPVDVNKAMIASLDGRNAYDAVIFAVAHRVLEDMIRSRLGSLLARGQGRVVIDLSGNLARSLADDVHYWRL